MSMIESGTLMEIQKRETTLVTGGPSSRIVTVGQSDAKQIKINHQDNVFSLEFLAGGKKFVGGGDEGRFRRRWRAEDGMD